ncbi:MAG TPA: cytochrome c peroxidase [Polyangiaceae bacterium]|nr:cytochrome c peroxidase [Polyangiaceae bacterium]
MLRRSLLTIVTGVSVCLVLVATARAEGPSRAELGRAIFFDRSLSEPQGTSCASCHDPERAFASNNGSSLGVARGSRPGHYARRATPSLLYLKFVPSFRFAQEGDDPQSTAVGGFFWDGRVDTITELARQPLLNPDEMNGRDGALVAEKIEAGPYAAAFRGAFGDALEAPETALAAVGAALEAYLTSEAMAPFTSKFDGVVRGEESFTPLEAEGLRLFKDDAKGACAQCHLVDETAREPQSSLFTDYGYDAVAPPNNARVPRAAKPDLGLCERQDRATPTNDPMFCVNFRTPSLRNVAVRQSFMHNGAFTSLRDVVAFYATRTTDPRRWYKSGVVFDSVPKDYRRQVNVGMPPYNRKLGDAPALDDAEIDAIVAFLRTLTDKRYTALLRR